MTDTSIPTVSCWPFCGVKFQEHNVRHFFPIADTLLSAVMIINFGVLTWLDRNIFYCGIVGQFLLIFLASFKFTLQRRIVWHPRNKLPILVYFWASLILCLAGAVCMGVLQYEIWTRNLYTYWNEHPTVFPIKYREVEVYLQVLIPVLGLCTLTRVVFYGPFLYKALDLFFNDPNYYHNNRDQPWMRSCSKNPSLSSTGTCDPQVLTWEDKIQMCRDAKGLATVKEEDSECNGTLLDPKNNTRVFHLQDSFSSQDGLRLNYSHSVNADKKWSLMPDRSASNSFETPKPKSLLDNYLKLGHKDH